MSNRRAFLAAIGSAVTLAGCAGKDGTATGTGAATTAGTGSATPTGSSTPSKSAIGSADGAWTQFGADSGNTDAAGVSGPTEAPSAEKLDPAGTGPVTRGSPVVGDGRLFQFGPRNSGAATPTEAPMGSAGPPELVARDPATGERLWGVPASGDTIDGGIAVAGETVVVAENDVSYGDGSSSRKLRGLSVTDGSEQWAVELSGTATAPTLADESVLVVEDGAGENPAVVRSVGLDGTERWSREHGEQFGDVVVNDGAAVVATYPASTFDGAEPRTVVTAHSPADGAEQWRVEYEAEHLLEFAAADGAVFLVFEDGRVLSLAVGDGSERWHKEVELSGPAGLTITGEAVHLASGTLWALDAADGTERWTAGEAFEVVGVGEYSAGGFSDVWAGAESVYGELTGSPSELVAIEPTTGEERWRRELPADTVDGEEISGFRGDPLVAEGAIYGVTPKGLYRYADSA